MTEVEAATPGAPWPELGAKSPEVPKPKSAPKGSTKNNNNRQRERKPLPADDGEPLIPPKEVKDPNQEEQDAKDAALRAQIEAENKKVADLEEKIVAVREERGNLNEATKAIREELKAQRAKALECAQERDRLVDELKKHSDGTKQQENALAKLRKELPPGKNGTDASVIEAQIAEMNQKLETSSMDLKSEKELIQTIKKRTVQKENIKTYEAELAKVTARKEAHEELYKKRQEIGERLTKLREEEKAIAARIEAARNGEGSADGVAPHTKLMELMDQKTKVIEGVKKKREEIKQSNVEFRIKFAEYREYQKALTDYERKVERREWSKRRAEQAQKQLEWKAEQKVRDEERKLQRAKQEQRFAAVYKGHQMYVGGLKIKSTEEEVLACFSKYGEVLDCVVVKDNETKLSRGFGFVTLADRSHAETAIKENNGVENKTLCPPHGRMNCKFAEKSKQQKEWEGKQRAREEREKAAALKKEEGTKEEGSKGEGKAKEAKESKPKEAKEAKEGKGKGKEAAAEAEEDDAEVIVDDAEADDFFAAFGGGADKVVLPPKKEEDKKEEKKEEKKEDKKEETKAEETKEDGEGKKEWQATRTDWVDGKEGGEEGEGEKEEGEGEGEKEEKKGGKKKKSKK